MSIGPKPKSELFQEPPVQRAVSAVKRNLKEFFERPIYYIFYIFLLVTMWGLFFGMNFDWPYYFILITLGLVELSKIYKKSN